MNIRGRIKRLERTTQAIELPAATRQDAMDWSARFRAHDPANAVLWDEIRAWGCRYHMDYIYADAATMCTPASA